MALWGVGLCPLHPPTEPKRHWLSLPLWHPAGGRGDCPLRGGDGWRSGTRRWRGGFGRPPAFYFSFVFSPIPPTPLPGGKGETQSFLMQGASPLASPGLNPRGTYRTCQAGARSGALPLAGRGWVAFRYPCNRVGRGTGTTIGIRSFYRKSKGICLFMDSAGSQGEGGPGERNFGV